MSDTVDQSAPAMQTPEPSVTYAQRPFSVEEERQLLDFRNRLGLLWTQIGKRLGRSADESRVHYDVLMRKSLRLPPKPKPKEIHCYSCREKFVSRDPARNRCCPRCKDVQKNYAIEGTATAVGDALDTTIEEPLSDLTPMDSSPVD